MGFTVLAVLLNDTSGQYSLLLHIGLDLGCCLGSASPYSSDVRRHRGGAAAIRAVYQRRREFAAAVKLRWLFPGITDTAQARECTRTIAGWKLRLRGRKAGLRPAGEGRTPASRA